MSPSSRKMADPYSLRKPATIRKMRLGSSSRDNKPDSPHQSDGEQIRNIIVETQDQQPATSKNANDKSRHAHLKPFRTSRSNAASTYQQEIV